MQLNQLQNVKYSCCPSSKNITCELSTAKPTKDDEVFEHS